MMSRRNFLAASGTGIALAATGTATAADLITNDPLKKQQRPMPESYPDNRLPYQLTHRIGLGGVALGNGFKVTTENQVDDTLEGAWNAGIRYFDTSPWYGLGLSERRFGRFLYNQPREEFVISTKIGRLMHADARFTHGMWKGKLNFNYTYDYTADGVKRSIEDSLNRLGLASIDIVFIHDLSPDNGDMGDNWTEYFDIAAKGAIPALTRLREEGVIKAWGFGVNRIEPVLKTLEIADPDLFLLATQYSLMYHEDALNRLFPTMEKRGVAIVVGAPLNAGFLAGLNRYNYGGTIPEGFIEKRDRISAIANAHGTDLRTAALQFSAAPTVVASVIPGARSGEHAAENAASMEVRIPADFWVELKQEKLIAENAPVPGDD